MAALRGTSCPSCFRGKLLSRLGWFLLQVIVLDGLGTPGSARGCCWGRVWRGGREQGLGSEGVAWGEWGHFHSGVLLEGWFFLGLWLLWSIRELWHQLWNCVSSSSRSLRNPVRNHKICISSSAASGLHDFPGSWEWGGTFWLGSFLHWV